MQREGINVRKVSPSTLLIVNLISPNGEYNDLFLSNYATIELRDELGRLPGVGGVGYLGQRDYSMRAWLDPDRLAAVGLSPADVVNAISQQNLEVAAGQIGQPPAPKGQQFQLIINTLGRLMTPEQFANIILKVGQGNPGSVLGNQGGQAAPSFGRASVRADQRRSRADRAGGQHRPSARRCPYRAGRSAIRHVLHPGR